MIIQHNISALNSWRNTKINTDSTSKNLEKLSSGSKINRSADDAAGLAISEKMRGQIRGLNQAQRNLQDGMSVTKTIDGAMQVDHEMLQRIRELLVQASNGTYTEEDRQILQEEIDHLLEEINQLSYRANFNKIRVLRAPSGEFPDWVGMDVDANGNLIGQMIPGRYTPTVGGVTQNLSAATIDFSNVTGYNVEDLCNTGFSFTCCTCNDRVVLRFNNTGDNSFDGSGSSASPATVILNVDVTGITSGEELVKHIMDVAYSTGALPQTGPTGAGFPASGGTHHATRFAIDPDNPNILLAHDNRNNQTNSMGTTNQVRIENNLVYQDPNIKIQAGANQNENITIPIKTVDTRTLGLSVKRGENLIVTSPVEAAMAAIDIVGNAINILSGLRADIGAVHNRMEKALNNVSSTAENLQSAESTIRDMDMAKGMMEFTKNNILVQAAQSMLAQANQLPQGVLSLLQ